MALRAVLDHPKLFALKTVLNCPRYVAVGCLESVWHFTGRYTPRGDIGKYADSAIEGWVEWQGKPGALIAALLKTGWLDLDPEHRILVHDWSEHADKATKNAILRCGQTFYHQLVRTPYTPCTDLVGLPVPEPVPVPVPGPVKKHSSPSAQVLTLYKAYPRHTAPEAAYPKIQKALTVRSFEELLLAIQNFKRKISRDGTDPRFIPHPATWFNQGRYDDEEFKPSYEVKSNGKSNGHQSNHEVLAAYLAELEDEDQSGANGSGGDAKREAGQREFEPLHQSAGEVRR